MTLNDIAVRTNFSVNTVSHALRGESDISISTRDYIRQVALEMGYIGNSLAGTLRTGQSRIVAVIIPDIANLYFSIMVKLLEMRLQQDGYSILVMNTEENVDREVEAVRAALRFNVDGIIITPTQKSTQAIELMKNNHIPFVLLGRWFEGRHYESVSPDDFQCGYLATEHLLSLGHRRLLLLNGPDCISSSQERAAGFIEALRCAGVPETDATIHPLNAIDNTTGGDLCQYIQDIKSFTGLITFSDLLAWQVIQTLQDHHLRVPQDVSLVSIDNIQSHMSIPFPLTTVDTAKEELARTLVESLFRLMREGFTRTSHITLTPTLVIRGSTLPYHA